MSKVLILDGTHNQQRNKKMPFNLKKTLNLPRPTQEALKTGALGAGGMVLNRMIAPRVLGFLPTENQYIQIAIKAATALAIGGVANRFMSASDATALMTGALAETMVEILNTVAPGTLQGGLGLPAVNRKFDILDPSRLSIPNSTLGLPFATRQRVGAFSSF